MNQFVNQTNSVRPSGEYSRVIADIANKGVCPFCSEHLQQYHKEPLEEGENWWITNNMYPYKPTLHHRLFIHKAHITTFTEISTDALLELQKLVSEEMRKGNITGGSFIMRFGDTKFTGASVSHLHAHIIQSDPDDPTYNSTKGLIMRIG